MPLMLSILIRCTLIGKKCLVKKEMRVSVISGEHDDADSLYSLRLLWLNVEWLLSALTRGALAGQKRHQQLPLKTII